MIHNIIFTGGGSRLKNISLLFEEYLPNFKTSIVADPQLAFECKPGVNTFGIFTTALYGLLNQGKVNCCEEVKYTQEPQAAAGELFSADAMTGNDTAHEEENAVVDPEEEERKRREEQERKRKEEEVERKKKEKERIKKEKEEKIKIQKEKTKKGMRDLFDSFKTFFQDATSEDENDEINKEDD